MCTLLPLQAMLEKMKTHKDRLLPGDESGNYKMWAACDLATGLLISKTTNYELKEYPRVSNRLLFLLAYPSLRANIKTEYLLYLLVPYFIVQTVENAIIQLLFHLNNSILLLRTNMSMYCSKLVGHFCLLELKLTELTRSQ